MICSWTPRASLAVAAIVTMSLAATTASAQNDVAGSTRAHFLASPEADLGAAVSADLWFPIDWFRIGGFIGVGAVPSEDDIRNRVFMPVGLSVGFEGIGDDVGVSVRGRAGFWGGATQEVKLTAGGFMSVGAYLLILLGDNVALEVGFDAWWLFGDGETMLLSPSLGLSWSPPDE